LCAPNSNWLEEEKSENALLSRFWTLIKSKKYKAIKILDL
jgi:hypothetical protein